MLHVKMEEAVFSSVKPAMLFVPIMIILLESSVKVSLLKTLLLV